jgi:uncharacterized repeat protein (TIGR02543 family)
VYTVAFDPMGGSAVRGQRVAADDTIDVPAEPVKGKLTFYGWFVDPAATTPYNFEEPVHANQTLYAGWSEPTKDFIVRFESDGGSPVPDQLVPDGQSAERPADPAKPGSTFEGWFLDAGLTEPYDFSQPVHSDLTLYAKWRGEPRLYTVRFACNGGSPVSDEAIADGQCAVKPIDPAKPGCSFARWCIDEALTTPYDFATPVHSDVTLYADWWENPQTHTVRFESNGGSPVADEAIPDGQSARRPTDPAKPGNTFAGWFSDAGLTTPYDFATPVHSDITL